MTHQQTDVWSQLSQAMADVIASKIFNIIVLCGRQNITLRGHRDNATDIEKDLADVDNHGNFRALLHFRVDATLLGQHLTAAARNATYTSSVIQNQVINVLADQVRQKIIWKVHRAKWFSVIADEVTDVSNKEQLSLVVRYTDVDTLLVREDLLGFFECNNWL